MNTKLFKLLTAGTLALLPMLLSSCGDSTVEYNQEAYVEKKATLTVVVRDNVSGKPLSASVKLLTTGAKANVDSLTGTVSFKEVPVGPHRLLIESKGYAVSSPTVSITSFNSSSLTGTAANGEKNLLIAKDTIVNENLYPLTSSLDGFVYYEDPSGVDKPANGATVKIQLTNANLVDRVFTATSDSIGKFSFPTLPAVGNQYTLYLLDWKTYSAIDLGGSLATLTADKASHILNSTSVRFTAANANSLFNLTTSKLNISSEDPIVLTFNGTIDVEKFKPTMVRVLNQDGNSILYNSGDEVPAEKTPEGSIITLVPKSGKWPNSVSVSLSNLTSVTGKTYTGTFATNNISIDPGIDVFSIIGYPTLIKSTDKLVLEFSDDIDASKFIPGTVTSSHGAIDKKVNGNKIEIAPLTNNGKWQGTFTITIGSLISANGKTFNNGTTYYTRTITVNDYAAPFYVVKFPEIVKPTDDLVFEFSDAIDAERFKPTNNVTFNYTTIQAEKIVDGKKLTLKPIGGKWNNSSFTGSEFTVTFSGLLAVSGKAIEGTDRYPITINELAAPFVVAKYPEVVKPTDVLVFEFNDEIDAERFKPAVNITSPTAAQAERIVEGKTLKLVPTNGNWNNSGVNINNGSFNVTFATGTNALVSVNGKTLSNTTTFPITINEFGVPFVVVKFDQVIGNRDTLYIEFSEEIDPAKFKPGYISVNGSDGIINANVNKILDGKTLKLVPAGDGRWFTSFSGNSPSITVQTNGTIYSIHGLGNGSSTLANSVLVSEGLAQFQYVKHDSILVNKTDAVKIKFNDAIDASKFRPSFVNAYYTTNGNAIATSFEKLVSADSTLILTPLGNWPDEFYFSLSSGTSGIVSVNGKGLASPGNLPVRTIQSLAALKVNGFAQLINRATDTLDWNNTTVRFRWNKVPGATGYRIYAKASAGWNKNDFVKVADYTGLTSSYDTLTTSTSISFGSDGQTTYNCTTNPSFPGISNATDVCNALGLATTALSAPYAGFPLGKTGSSPSDSLQFFIQAYNSYSETKLLTSGIAADDPLRPTVVTVKDTKKPIWATSAGGTSNRWSQPNAASTADGKGEYVAMWFGSRAPSVSGPSTYTYDEFDDDGNFTVTNSDAGNKYFADNGFNLTATSGIARYRFGKLEIEDTTGATVVAATSTTPQYSQNTNVINFSEFIDTASVTIEYAEKPAGLSRFSVRKAWSTDGRTLYLTPFIDVGNKYFGDADSVSFKVQVKGIKDNAGNLFREEYDPNKLLNPIPPATKVPTNDLEFRFVFYKNALAQKYWEIVDYLTEKDVDPTGTHTYPAYP